MSQIENTKKTTARMTTTTHATPEAAPPRQLEVVRQSRPIVAHMALEAPMSADMRMLLEGTELRRHLYIAQAMLEDTLPTVLAYVETAAFGGNVGAALRSLEAGPWLLGPHCETIFIVASDEPLEREQIAELAFEPLIRLPGSPPPVTPIKDVV